MANRRKVKNIKGQIVGFLFLDGATEVLPRVSYEQFQFYSAERPFLLLLHCTTYGNCGITGTIRRLPHNNPPSCSIKNIRLLHNNGSQWLSEQMTGFIASLVGSNPREGNFLFFILNMF